MRRFFPTEIIPFIGAVFMIIGALRLPYAYYNFLRGLITIISFYGIIAHLKSSKMMMLIYIIVLVMFNPVFEIHLSKTIWHLIDIVFGFMLLYLSYEPDGYKD